MRRVAVYGLAVCALLASTACRLAATDFETRFLPDLKDVIAAAIRKTRSVLARRCAVPPRIDGSLADPAWRAADAQGDFVIVGDVAKRMMLAVIGSLKPGEPLDLPAGRPVTIRLVYDDTYLYAAFDIAEPEPAGLRREHRVDDNRLLWQDDTAEIILDPDADRKRYFHFMVNANGKVTDGEFGPGIHRLEQMKWTCKWKCASRLADGKWVVEIAIPFKDLRAPVPIPGTVWLGNFGHSKLARFKRKLPNGMDVNANGEFSSWMGVDKAYHELWNLGEIVFDRPPRVKIVSVDWNDPAWGANSANVVLLNQGRTPLAVRVAIAGLTSRPMRGTLPPAMNVTFSVPFRVKEKGKPIGLTLQIEADGRVLTSRRSQAELPARIFDILPREGMLWDGETSLPMDFQLHVGQETTPSLRIEILANGRRKSFVPETRRGTCVVPIGPKGDAAIQVELVADGKTVESRDFVVPRLRGPAKW